jgi:uncharacterized protein (DUF1778 family)
MPSRAAQTSVISVRVSPHERALLEAAAHDTHTNLSDFVRRKSLESAEIEALSRTVVTIPAGDWDKFESWLHRPPEKIPALGELLRRKPTWEK